MHPGMPNVDLSHSLGQPEENGIPPQPPQKKKKNENEINKLELSINTALKGNTSVNSHWKSLLAGLLRKRFLEDDLASASHPLMDAPLIGSSWASFIKAVVLTPLTPGGEADVTPDVCSILWLMTKSVIFGIIKVSVLYAYNLHHAWLVVVC